MKQKDDQEFVGIYNAKYKEKVIIVKVFLTLGDRNTSKRATKEITALQMLTEAKCKHSPRYLGDFKRQFDGLICGTEHYVLMSKVSGQTLYSYRRIMSPTRYELNKKTIEEAFKLAINDVQRAGVDNGSPHDENILWDPRKQKCYIIDFERATFQEEDAPEPESWNQTKELSNWIREC